MPATDLNPGEKVKKANGEYHEAIDEVLLNDIPVDIKCRVGAKVNEIFARMSEVNTMLKEHYEIGEE